MPANTVSAKSFRRPRLAAWWLMAIAFAIPALGLLHGAYDDVELAFMLICEAVALVVIAGVAWIVTRRRSARTKAFARVAVGILLCLNTSVHLFNDIRSHEAVTASTQQLPE